VLSGSARVKALRKTLVKLTPYYINVDWIAGLLNPDCNPIWWIALSIKFCHFNPNPKLQDYFIKKLKFYSASCSNNEAKLVFIKIFKQLIYQ